MSKVGHKIVFLQIFFLLSFNLNKNGNSSILDMVRLQKRYSKEFIKFREIADLKLTLRAKETKN